MKKNDKWQARARQEQEAMKLWGMICSLTAVVLAVTALVALQ